MKEKETNMVKKFLNLMEFLLAHACLTFICGVGISMALILGGGLVFLMILPFVAMSPVLLTTFEKFSSDTELLFTVFMYLWQLIVICSLIAAGVIMYRTWKEDQQN